LRYVIYTSSGMDQNYHAIMERIMLTTHHPSHTRNNRVIDLYLIDNAISSISENGNGRKKNSVNSR
jgi:hypothetical protein